MKSPEEKPGSNLDPSIKFLTIGPYTRFPELLEWREVRCFPSPSSENLPISDPSARSSSSSRASLFRQARSRTSGSRMIHGQLSCLRGLGSGQMAGSSCTWRTSPTNRTAHIPVRLSIHLEWVSSWWETDCYLRSLTIPGIWTTNAPYQATMWSPSSGSATLRSAQPTTARLRFLIRMNTILSSGAASRNIKCPWRFTLRCTICTTV